MKRFLTIICALAFSGAALSAQNTADIVNVNGKDTPFVSLKAGGYADVTNTGIRTFANPAVGVDISRFSIKVGYEYRLGCWRFGEGISSHHLKCGLGFTF